MHGVCASAATGPTAPHAVELDGSGWWVEHAGGRSPVAEPLLAPAPAAARPLGADTADWLR